MNIIESGAEISPDNMRRYDLWRVWDKSKPYVLFIGLNPSTADAMMDDPTIRRCKRFAFDWGFGGVHMGNLFAYRATNPKEMKQQIDPVGFNNDYHLCHLAERAGIIICAWGADGGHHNRDQQVIKLLNDLPLFCLGKTKGGQPRHPLYLKSNVKPEVFA